MPQSFDEAFPGGFEECVRELGQEPSVDDPEALCGWLQEHGFEALSEASDEVTDVLLNLDVEYVSVVDSPAQDSEWLLAKSADADPNEWNPEDDPLNSSDVLLKQGPEDAEEDDDEDEPERKVWAAVLEPETPDKQGDMVPRTEIEETAHNYLKNYRKVDEDHNLLDGSGVPIESYIVRDGPETFDLPDGSEKTHPEGTWIMGVELSEDAWKRVEEGDLTGFSIYGGATSLDPEKLLTDDQTAAMNAVQVARSVAKQVEPEEFEFENEDAARLVAEAFGMEGVHERDGSYMPGESHDALLELLEQINETEDDEEDENEQETQEQGDGEKPDDYDEDDDEDDEDEEEKSTTDPADDRVDAVLQTVTKMAENGNDDGNEDEQNDKLDEILSKVEDTSETVEDVQKSISSVEERVEELEEWKKSVVGTESEGDEGDDEGDDEGGADLTEEEVEDIASDAAEDAAEEGAEKALTKFLGLDDDELPDDPDEREEVVRKGVRQIGGVSEEADDGETIDTSNSGIMEEI